MTTREKIEKIVKEHCRYCDRDGTMYELRCEGDIEGQLDQIMEIIDKEKQDCYEDGYNVAKTRFKTKLQALKKGEKK